MVWGGWNKRLDGISLIYGVFYHVFPDRDRNGKVTITSNVFKAAMTKRGGFLKRHSGTRVAMDNAPCHNGTFKTFRENQVVVLDFPQNPQILTLLKTFGTSWTPLLKMVQTQKIGLNFCILLKRRLITLKQMVMTCS